ncbi:hypothetical protein J1N35_043929 [Gossypium stocksii]|uniref:Uncharacterized protein n=1 Tax=Gossypium stocksii TaxID=47602 RepID=A0A9D3U8F7_9ROSI|nr:hypothetical protein J1N35_043929 [Gossypium stocksii]
MITLEENNRKMRETISKLSYSSPTPQVLPVNRGGNSFSEATLLYMNNNNGDNTPINILSSRNTNITNPSITISRATFTIFGASTGVVGASTIVAFKTTS